ncbi:MAG: hypothetical protein A2513_04580 [Sulfurimonas sp. RIFOXYD12_FULL_33_39]|uniref:hypothetical protein n=1 Tax=unclassified Sulfurimonas TaxID=2623549 RepID=UPI0008CB38C1|nr:MULTISPECIES: hypothetical protein [unclassified Sulfurimonas]OHE09403.1 MAG: hypothetical protein A2513_04580 [Sulfurimonas sp. RIFOXYD12_FULL_33_39]OHE12815.1 MAG: hypothetical protein A2530_04225 [Sulfurimonas sp. RIFOXYD2_FULL_34_21]DAB28266.1 MAG TPA: hypothetical protein CFH78_03375 [Sulfurimonas sp. UBA10385]
MKIKLCKNYPKKNKLVKKLTLNYPSAEIKVKSCIGMCKYCKLMPTAIIDGKKVKKKSIKKFIKALHVK